MTTNDAIRAAIASGEMITLDYVDDLTDAEMLQRACPGANHINWQFGHLIASEHWMLEKAVPGYMPALPEGFEARYSRERAGLDDGSAFDSKAVLLETFREQRAGTLAALERMQDEDFDRETGIDYAPTVGALFLMQSTHWLMHAGQWAIVRRQLGRPPLY